ncbi:MAG: hypothetical protein MZV64_49380 [Ignavibacteriales bacterium]|nr:hypothetical protein [Ignavibacteriales bacterium]
MDPVRSGKRTPTQLRPIKIAIDTLDFADGSALIEMGPDARPGRGHHRRAGAAVPQGDRPRLGHGRVRHAAPGDRRSGPRASGRPAASPGGPRRSSGSSAGPCGP